MFHREPVTHSTYVSSCTFSIRSYCTCTRNREMSTRIPDSKVVYSSSARCKCLKKELEEADFVDKYRESHGKKETLESGYVLRRKYCESKTQFVMIRVQSTVYESAGSRNREFETRSDAPTQVLFQFTSIIRVAKKSTSNLNERFF